MNRQLGTAILAAFACGLALAAEVLNTPPASARGEWCGCLKGPQGCARPCSGCCGGDEAACFSGMDPGAHKH